MTYETINLTKQDFFFSIYQLFIGSLMSGVNVWNGIIYYSVIPAPTVSECCMYHIYFMNETINLTKQDILLSFLFNT